MSEQTIGTCSLCGGPVRVASPWLGINPPVPKCARCHATKRGHGPVIEMERRGPSPVPYRVALDGVVNIESAVKRAKETP